MPSVLETPMGVKQAGKQAGGGHPWLPFVLIIAASALAHIWCLGSQFYLDDPTQIRDNEAIRVGDVFHGVALRWTNFGYFIQYKLFGLSPVGYHAVNWLLHTAVACVLFGFGRDFIRGPPRISHGSPCFPCSPRGRCSRFCGTADGSSCCGLC
ncbi:MAG: hypothetical protein MUF86_16250 [Akkermansiaceae bacterium]|nr:hypothetical protein [Akkermansiaceae bacterium]